MAESIKNFLAEIKEQVNDILTETGNTTQAFTRYVLDAMCEKGNLGEAEECYAVIRHMNLTMKYIPCQQTCIKQA